MESYILLLKEKLCDELYRHSLGTANTAKDLASYYGENEEKAYLAGLVHDYGKIYSAPELLKKAAEQDIYLDRYTRNSRKLLHAPVGAVLIKSELEIDDPAIFNAVACHTTGKVGMSLFDRILYLADFIEPDRDYEGVEVIRDLAYEDFEGALLRSVEITIHAVLNRGLLLHPRSVAFRNSLVFEKGVKL